MTAPLVTYIICYLFTYTRSATTKPLVQTTSVAMWIHFFHSAILETISSVKLTNNCFLLPPLCLFRPISSSCLFLCVLLSITSSRWCTYWLLLHMPNHLNNFSLILSSGVFMLSTLDMNHWFLILCTSSAVTKFTITNVISTINGTILVC